MRVTKLRPATVGRAWLVHLVRLGDRTALLVGAFPTWREALHYAISYPRLVKTLMERPTAHQEN